MFIKIGKCGWVIPFRQCSSNSQIGAMSHSRPHSKLVAVLWVLMECLARLPAAAWHRVRGADHRLPGSPSSSHLLLPGPTLLP